MNEDMKEIGENLKEIRKSLAIERNWSADKISDLNDKVSKIDFTLKKCLEMLEVVINNPSQYAGLVRALRGFTEDEMTLLGHVIQNGKDVFLLSVDHHDWVKEAIRSLTEKEIFRTDISMVVFNNLSSGMFYIHGVKFSFLFENRDVIYSGGRTIKEESELYKDDGCDSLLCHANDFAEKHDMETVTAEQLLSNKIAPGIRNEEGKIIRKRPGYGREGAERPLAQILPTE